MARHNVVICDVCGRPAEHIAGTLVWIPNIPGVQRRTWNNYTHRADIGDCCKEKVFADVNFRKRMTRTEYQKSRTERANRSTVRTKQNAA